MESEMFLQHWIFIYKHINLYIYILYLWGGESKLTITCSFVFLAVILSSNIACLSFSARAVLILEDSVAFFYSVLGPVGASMLKYHEEQVSVRSQHRRHQHASQVKIVAKKYKLGDHIYGVDCIYLTDIPSMSVNIMSGNKIHTNIWC